MYFRLAPSARCGVAVAGLKSGTSAAELIAQAVRLAVTIIRQ